MTSAKKITAKSKTGKGEEAKKGIKGNSKSLFKNPFVIQNLGVFRGRVSAHDNKFPITPK
jgi:hypothetical protein